MRKRTILVVTMMALALAGCGGGSGGSGRTTAAAAGKKPKAASGAYVVKADAICSAMITRAREFGRELSLRSNLPSNPLVLTTRVLIRPAIPIVETSARELRALKQEAESSQFDAYVNVFDPVIALLRERVAAGEAGDADRAQKLELQLIDLIGLQRSLARKSNLKRCDVDFIKTFAAPGQGR
jgi:hypothetical protein